MSDRSIAGVVAIIVAGIVLFFAVVALWAVHVNGTDQATQRARYQACSALPLAERPACISGQQPASIYTAEAHVIATCKEVTDNDTGDYDSTATENAATCISQGVQAIRAKQR